MLGEVFFHDNCLGNVLWRKSVRRLQESLSKMLAVEFRERLTSTIWSSYVIAYNINKKVSRSTNYCNVLMEEQTFEILGLRCENRVL